MSLLSPDRFRGVILNSPMLGIEDDIRPHPLVEGVLRRVVAPMLPTWPITPGGGEDGMPLAMRDPEYGKATFYTNDLGGGTAKLRLRTAVELGFVGCTWLQQRLPELKTPFLIVHAVSCRRVE